MRFTFFFIAILLVAVEPGLLLADVPRNVIRIADGAQTPDTAPQKAILYEEDSANPNGVQHDGTAVWRVEQVPSPAGQTPGVIILADIEIPARGMSVRVFLRRNDDPQLPASHIIDVMLTLPPDFDHVGIRNIPGIMMKPDDRARGEVLNGIAAKVTDNRFVVGLSSRDADVARNVQLLKERPWFQIPMVYTDGKRALIVFEKGGRGDSVFSEAFAAWERQDRMRPVP